MKTAIIGASGYTGGELLRLLLDHPEIEVTQATSENHLGEFIYQRHPNLRKRTRLKFTSSTTLEPCDLLFLALPHGESSRNIEQYIGLANRLIDLSADFRISNPDLYMQYYGKPHPAPQRLKDFVYGLPECHRDELKTARCISGVGCNATVTNLALLPLVKNDLIDTNRPVIVDIKVGSSEGGASPNPGSHHAERTQVVRTFSAYGHRHTGEVIQELGLSDIHLTMTSVDLVRGALAAGHCFVKPGTTEKDLWKVYRSWAETEHFIRLVKDRRGIYRVPEPKILAGTNYVDVGFELDPSTGRVVALAAIDNLMKGAAGSAVQSMNLMYGFPETMGLEFSGLHPI